MKNKKNNNILNTFSGRISSMVLLTAVIISISISAVVLKMSQNIFMDTYGQSQEKVFSQIEEELNILNDDMQKVMEEIDSSWAFRTYLTGASQMDNVEQYRNMYQMEQDLTVSSSSDLKLLNIMVLGMQGQDYLSRTETIYMTKDEILDSPAAAAAMDEPERMHYTFAKGGYTQTNKDIDVIIVSKALYYRQSRQIYGIVFITLNMEDLQKYYDYFVTDNSSFYMVDAEDTVVCSSRRGTVGKTMDDSWYIKAKNAGATQCTIREKGQYLTVMCRELPYQQKKIYGVVDNRLALTQLYNMPLLIGICLAIGCLILAVSFFFARETIRPLSTLVQKMSGIKGGHFQEYMPVEGTLEVQELAKTYNYMLDDMEKYIAELMHTQQEKRKSEIKALQMQINPHFIYNTLASIKMLVYQNDTKKTITTIDAFISLLRNTINNTDELVTISREIENLRNYMQIIQARYGDAVQMEFYVSRTCQNCEIPKLILQPFVENAFFHGYPSGQKGTIQIYIEKQEDMLKIRIMDDGVGLHADTDNKVSLPVQRKEHFSGIGIHNIRERLQLMYAEKQSLSIENGPFGGTVVTIQLPARTKE